MKADVTLLAVAVAGVAAVLAAALLDALTGGAI